MALVIRKYNTGGGFDRNSDYAPIEIYGKYYDPVVFADLIILAAHSKIRNTGMSQEEARAFMLELNHDLDLILNGQATFGDDRMSINNTVGENNDGIIRKGRWYKGLSNDEKRNNASVMATTHIMDMINGNYIPTWSSPKKYTFNVENLINSAYSDPLHWLDLDEQDTTTGKRGTTYRYKEIARLYMNEADKLNSNIKYRRGFSYGDDDLSRWSMRYNDTVQLLRDAASKYEDGVLSDEDITWLRTNGFSGNINHTLFSLDTAEYRAYLAALEALQQQLQQQELQRLSTNYFNPHLPWEVENLSGVFNGREFTYSNFDISSHDNTALQAWNEMLNSYMTDNGIYLFPADTAGDDLLETLKNLNYKYILNLSNNFSGKFPVVLFKKSLNEVGSMFILKDGKWHSVGRPTLTNEGYTVLVGDQLIILGTYDSSSTPTSYMGSLLDGTNANWESEIVNFGNINLNSALDWEDLWARVSSYKSKKGIKLLGLIRSLSSSKITPLKYNNQNLWGWRQNTRGTWFFYLMSPALKKTIWILAPKDNINDSSVYNLLGTIQIKRAGGVLSYRVGGPTRQSPSPDTIGEPEDTPQPPTSPTRTPNASLSSEANLLEEYETLQELTGSDYVRLGASLADLASVGAAFVPGLNIASAITGAGASTGEFLSDMWDLVSGRENAQGFWSAVGEYATNLGMDAVSLLPTGKLAKAGSILKGIIKYVPHIAGVVQTTNLITDPNLRQSMMVTLGKLNKGNITALNTQDFRNIAYLGSTFLGLKGGIKSLKRPAKTNNVEVEYSVQGTSTDKRTAIISKDITKKADIQKEIAAQLNRGKAEGAEIIKPEDIQVTTNALGRVRSTRVRESSEDTFRQVGLGNSGIFRDRDGLGWWFSDANLARPGTRIGRMYGVPDPVVTTVNTARSQTTVTPVTSPTPAVVVNAKAPRVTMPGVSTIRPLAPNLVGVWPAGKPRQLGTPQQLYLLPAHLEPTFIGGLTGVVYSPKVFNPDNVVLPYWRTVRNDLNPEFHSIPTIPVRTRQAASPLTIADRFDRALVEDVVNASPIRVRDAIKVSKAQEALNEIRRQFTTNMANAGRPGETIQTKYINYAKRLLKDKYRLTDDQVASLRKRGGVLSTKDELAFKAFEAFRKGGRVKKYLLPSDSISNVNYPDSTTKWNYGEIWDLFNSDGSVNTESAMWIAIKSNDTAEEFNLLQDLWKYNIWRNGQTATSFDADNISKSNDSEEGPSTTWHLLTFNGITNLNKRLGEYFNMNSGDSGNSHFADGYIGRATWARNYGLNLTNALITALNKALLNAGKNWRIHNKQLNNEWSIALAYTINGEGDEVSIKDQVDLMVNEILSDVQKDEDVGLFGGGGSFGTEYASTTPLKEPASYEFDEIGALLLTELLNDLHGVGELRDILRGERPVTVMPPRKDRAVHDAALQVALTKDDAGNLLANVSVASSGNPRLALLTKLAALDSVQAALDKANTTNYSTFITSKNDAQEAADYNLALQVTAGNANNAAYIALLNRQLGLDAQASAVETQLLGNYLAERRDQLGKIEDNVKAMYALNLDRESNLRWQLEVAAILLPYITKAKDWNNGFGDQKVTYDSDEKLLDAYFAAHTEEFEVYSLELLQLNIDITKDHTAQWQQLYTPSYGPVRYTPGYTYQLTPYGLRYDIEYNKKGGSLSAKDKLELEEKKQWAKTVRETTKENAKTIRENNKEFHKTYRSLSAGTLYLLKKAMGE